MDPLFAPLPENLADVSDEDIAKLLEEHEAAAQLIDSDDDEFLKGLSADEIIEQYAAGVEAIKTLRAEHKERQSAHDNFVAKREELRLSLEAKEDDDEGGEEGGDAEAVEAEVVAEAEAILEEAVEEAPAEEPELVTAAAEAPKPRLSRTPPAPAPNRIAVSTVEASEKGAALVASGGYKADYPEPLNPRSLTKLVVDVSSDLGPLQKSDKPGTYVTDAGPAQIEHYSDGRRVEVGAGRQIVWDGPRTKIAKQVVDFPEERTLTGGDDDLEKIRSVMPNTMQFLGEYGGHGGEALTASGGLCAPLTPIYTMPNFGTEAEPVWDALPVFRAARGGVNVPDATYIGDITSAISNIYEAWDAEGGSLATKSCQDLDCPDYTEVPVQILAHCREYGNLNGRAWPEKIQHENALTMQALVRTQDGFLLDRIKNLSVQVTNGDTGQGALIYTIEAIVRASFGIRGRLRMPREARFRWVLPYWVPDILVLDTVSTQFDRFRDQASLVAYLRSVGIDPVFYLDTPSTGTTQLPDSEQTGPAVAIDATPANFQSAFYPEGAFLGIDSGTLELGIVRDSTLNSTNDFQVFGERFRNVARLAPAQACYWITTTYCAAGIFPALGTARSCP